MYNYSGEQLRESDSEREYFTNAEIYISNAAATNLRKYKKQHESDSRPKEKSNWLGLGGKGHTTSGHWRPAVCKLTKEMGSDRCLLNIYIDESVLFQTVFIHLLRQTDIRPADNSLFFRKDCIAIHPLDHQRWVANNSAEPVHLQFPRSELCSLWTSLLRSHAIPEIYGRWMNRPDAGGVDHEGGSYRMWREVQLSVAQGRNLGISKVYDPSQNLDEIGQGVELKDIDVYCEILLNETVCARTTIKKGLGLPEWHESFTFSDLPPFESLDIMIWKEKKVLKPSLLGRVSVDLITFRRGELLEGWYPVQSTNLASQLQLGELRLKVKVIEEIILPFSSYVALQRVLSTRNILRWMQDLEDTLHVKTLPYHLIHLAISQDTIIEQIQEAAVWEVEREITSHQTMFRGNNVFTKTMEKCIAWYGNVFLEASIGRVLRELITNKVAIEVDPMRSGKASREVGKNVDLLVAWCNEFWKQIFAVKDSCPKELCALLSTIRLLVEEHGRRVNLPAQMLQQRPWQSVSAFVFLRFIVPGILHPHLFGLCSGLPDPSIQRSLKLIAKVIQSMANLNIGDQKEISMGGVRDFIKTNMSDMMEYLEAVSTAKTTIYSSQKFDDHEARHALNNMLQHKKTLSVLEREAVHGPPHYVDPSRELAIIASAIIRHSRDIDNRTRARKLDNPALEHLCATCFEVEVEALQRVNELATRLAQERRRASASAAWTKPSTSIPKSPSLGSIPAAKFSHPQTGPVSTTTVEVNPQPSTRLDQGQTPSSITQVAGFLFREKSDPSRADNGQRGKVKQRAQQDVSLENLDEGAKRKKSFMRGIFGSL